MQTLTTHLTHALLSRQNIWNFEVMEAYPGHLEHYPQEFLGALLKSKGYWANWECHHDLSALPAGREKQEIEDFLSLCQLTQKSQIVDPAQTLSALNLLYIKEKKIEELAHIVSSLQMHAPELLDLPQVEIGGGKGHLAYAMATLTNSKVISIDQSSGLQELGKKRLKKYLPEQGLAQVEFLCHTVNRDLKQLPSQIPSNSFLLGLHTCGPLAIAMGQLLFQSQAKAMINFGCCYLHLNPSTDVNLSPHFQANPFPWTVESLTHATRAHRPIDRKEFEFYHLVKSYRWALHLFLYREFGWRRRVKLGPSHASLYRQDFSIYAQNNLARLKLDRTFSDQSLQNFYNSLDTQKSIDEMKVAQIYRNLWGRGLEIILLLDRAMFWQSQDAHVELASYFPENKSPRNLGILVTKK